MQRKILQVLTIFMAAAYFVSGCTTAPQRPAKLVAGNYDYVKESMEKSGLLSWDTR